MLVQPPAADILGPIHPRLAISTVGDRGAALRRAIFIQGVEPVKAFAALDVRLQIGQIVDRRPACQRVEMPIAVAPIRQRHIVVDAHEVGVGIGAERIEVEEQIARSVLRLVAETFRPVGGIAELGARTQYRPACGGQTLQSRHRRIGAGARSELGQPAQLAADQEGIDTTGRHTEVGVMQHHPAQAPVGQRAGPRHRGT